MKILIVDDDNGRAIRLRDFLASGPSFVETDIDIVACMDEAKRALRSVYYDGLVLDVVIPKRRNETASAMNGISLIKQLSRDAALKKPEKIIGLTAHLDDLHKFRETFEETGTVVVEARSSSSQWLTKIAKALEYTSASMLSRFVASRNVTVFSIHGIRTYGAWQNRLRRLVEAQTDKANFYTYKYGYFSTFSFAFPPLRRREVRRLTGRIRAAIDVLPGRRVCVFSHSFGTYLAVEALKSLLGSISEDVELKIILSGSVLKSNFDWSFLSTRDNISVVNECGSDDSILLISNALALGFGMAGRCGFNGFSRRGFVNRYFVGGHSHYFTDNDFMNKYWLPILSENSTPSEIDQRVDSSVCSIAMESITNAISSVKIIIYLCLLVSFIFLVRDLFI